MTTRADSQARTSRMPVLHLSHGAPPLADARTWTAELASWSADLPRPTSVLVVSAHWEDAPLREQGTLIVGSGFTTHNLRWFEPSAGADAPAPTASREFDAWARAAMASAD
ncbi:MAG: hypothetical protein ACYCV4_13085, partial [Dermatophilaceae bacterium]